MPSGRLLSAAFLMLAVLGAASSVAQSFDIGDVVVTGLSATSPERYRIIVMSSSGVFKRQIGESILPFGEVAFSPGGVLHVAADDGIRRVDPNGNVLSTFGTIAFDFSFDAAGNLWATTNQDPVVDQYDVSGALRQRLNAGERIGDSELGADQCTLNYFTIGAGIRRFDVCRAAPRPPIGERTVRNGPELRLLADGTALVAQFGTGQTPAVVLRVDASGAVIQTYRFLSVIALAPDGTSMWGAMAGDLYRVDLATGATLTGPVPTGLRSVSGLAVFGERRVAQSAHLTEVPTLSTLGAVALVCGILGIAILRFR